ncbi:hypothetical protein V8C42DRAFT_182886 [Trichoderma barbatum]
MHAGTWWPAYRNESRPGPEQVDIRIRIASSLPSFTYYSTILLYYEHRHSIRRTVTPRHGLLSCITAENVRPAMQHALTPRSATYHCTSPCPSTGIGTSISITMRLPLFTGRQSSDETPWPGPSSSNGGYKAQLCYPLALSSRPETQSQPHRLTFRAPSLSPYAALSGWSRQGGREPRYVQVCTRITCTLRYARHTGWGIGS